MEKRAVFLRLQLWEAEISPDRLSLWTETRPVYLISAFLNNSALLTEWLVIDMVTSWEGKVINALKWHDVIWNPLNKVSWWERCSVYADVSYFWNTSGRSRAILL